MNQDIENIIDKKHNELFKIDFNLDYNTKLNLQRAILDSLADEVLKVVKDICEKIDMSKTGTFMDKYLEESYQMGARHFKELLSEHLFPNKENKNNG